MRFPALGWIGSVWGLSGVLLLLGAAVWRLFPMAMAAFDRELHGLHWLGFAMSLAFFGYSEGYRGFQRAFSPRVVARAFALAASPRPGHILLAPAFCMSFFHAPARRMISSWALATGIVGLVLLIRVTPQPWRGMVDLGVIAGLSWGMVAIVVFWIRALRGTPLPVPPELPVRAPSRQQG